MPQLLLLRQGCRAIEKPRGNVQLKQVLIIRSSFYSKTSNASQVSHYRFSISWSRVIPQGVGPANALGIQYYKDVIAALKAAGIKPMVTIPAFISSQFLHLLLVVG